MKPHEVQLAVSTVLELILQDPPDGKQGYLLEMGRWKPNKVDNLLDALNQSEAANITETLGGTLVSVTAIRNPLTVTVAELLPPLGWVVQCFQGRALEELLEQTDNLTKLEPAEPQPKLDHGLADIMNAIAGAMQAMSGAIPPTKPKQQVNDEQLNKILDEASEGTIYALTDEPSHKVTIVDSPVYDGDPID